VVVAVQIGTQQQINMANWTVSSYSNTETQGDNVNAGSMATYADLTITPNTGYIIDKTGFKIGGATESPTNTWTGGNVDSEVYKVEFINDPADDSKVGTVDNKVTARVYWDSTALGGTPWSMPGNSDTIYIDIDEKTTVVNLDRYFCLLSKHIASQDANGTNKHTVTYGAAPTGITITNQAPLIHNVGTGQVAHHISGTVQEGVPTLIYQATFTANTINGYYYDPITGPIVQVLSAGIATSNYSIVRDNQVLNSNGKLTSIRFSISYTAPAGTRDLAVNAGGMCELGHQIVFTHKLRQPSGTEPGSTLQVAGVLVDRANINPNGEIRNIEVFGDAAAQCTFKIVSSDASKTYDFGPTGSGINGTFTASATDSAPITFGTIGNPMWPIYFPSVSVDRTYDVIVTPISPTTAAPVVPVAANQLRLYQRVDAVVTLGLLDGGSTYTDSDLLDGDPNTAITMTGRSEQQGKTHEREFSYKIMPAMLSSGSTLAVKAAPDFSLDTEGVSTSVNGDISLTPGDGGIVNIAAGVDLTSVAVVGMEVNWTVQKRALFDLETDVHLAVSAYDSDVFQTTVNTDNIVPGMLVTSAKISADENITVDSVEGGSYIILSRAIEATQEEIFTFTTQGITINSITDADTFITSQTLAETDRHQVKSGLEIELGGGESDVVAWVDRVSATKVVNDVFIAGTFNVSSFPQAATTVKLDLNKIIDVT